MCLPCAVFSIDPPMSDDPYSALGLKKSASDDEIKKAYRKIARTCHPDLNPDDKNAEERFKAAAYDLVKDPENRARFDRGEIVPVGPSGKNGGITWNMQRIPTALARVGRGLRMHLVAKGLKRIFLPTFFANRG